MTVRADVHIVVNKKVSRRAFVASALAGMVVAPRVPIPATEAAGRVGQGKATASNDLRIEHPGRLPSNVEAVIAKVLRQDPGSLNTNWNGSFQVEGLLHWSTRGLTAGREFALRWFADHRKRDPYRDDEYFHGQDSRVIRTGVLPFSTYCGLYSLSFACHEIYRQTKDEAARQACLDIADAILHQAARGRHGMVAHDDERFVTMAIPDVVYFVARALMIGSVLDPDGGEMYLRQALYQIRTYTDIFLDEKVGLAKTVLFPAGLGTTYWTRASGWLAWALTSVLKYLPEGHPAFADLVEDLQRLADGVASVQTPRGALRVLLDDPDTPEETSGTAMCIGSFHVAMNRGWLPDRYRDFVSRGWDFVHGNVTEEGDIRQVYTGWAIPAEEGTIVMDHREFGWIPGVIMKTAFELTA